MFTFLAWLYARIERVYNLVERWYDEIKLDVLTLKVFLIYLAIAWFDLIKTLVKDWFGLIEKIVQDWFDLIETIVKDWFDLIKTLVKDWFGLIGTLVGKWFDLIKTLVQDWFDLIGILVVVWFSLIKTLVVLWFNLIRFVVLDLLPFLVKLAVDWYVQLRDLILKFWGMLLLYVQDWKGKAARVFEDFYTPMAAFFTNPVRLIFGMLEAYLWPFLEWWLATILWGVEGEPPKRPSIFEEPGVPPPPGGVGPGTGELIWPCSTRRISGNRYQQPPGHAGLDIGTPTGEPIWSIAAGVVASIQHGNTGYGNYVTINHDNGAWSLYAHLQTIYVWGGRRVRQGEVIATADNTGASTGSHLHIEVKIGGSYRDPERVLD